jgi:signal transduction histidine kinase
VIVHRFLSIRRILVLVSLFFLLLPVGSIYFLRIYESALIRQTESELISQGAFVAALYRHEVRQILDEKKLEPMQYGVPVHLPASFKKDIRPILPRLDLARDSIYPPRPEPLYTHGPLDAVAAVAGKRILPILQDGQRITLSGIKILDYQGLVVAGAQEKGLSFAHTEEFQRAKSGNPVSLLRTRRMPKSQAKLSSVSRNSTLNVFVALPIILDEGRLVGVVWLNRTPVELSQALYSKRKELAWTVFVLLLVSSLMTLLTSLTITRPIRALVRKTRLIAQGYPEGLQPLNNPITREIAELSENIVRMATTIQHRSEYIRNFAAHVSHAFKTPLTAIRGSVELLEDNLDEMPREQQRRFLRNISQDTDRLGRLVSGLLELARADMAERSGSYADVRTVLNLITDRNRDLQLAVTLPPEPLPEPLMVAIPLASLEAVLMNLIENSCQAGANRLEISVRLQADCLVLDVQDNGPGISASNRKDIFTPFFTTRQNQGGTGLGLSIVNALLKSSQGSIALMSGTSGAHFRIELPRA